MIVSLSRPADNQRSRAGILFWAVAGILVAWALYRPDRVRPFDVLDFGEFIPLLKATESWTEQFSSVLDYGITQSGRANVLQVLAAVLKWRWFGDWMPGWQLVQAAIMGIVTAQSFLLLRRFGATVFGAAAGASVFLFAPSAARGWVRLTMAEPMAMVCVLALALRATGFQNRQRWRPDLWWFAFGAVFVILTKELMAPVLLLPVYLAVASQTDGGFSRPLWSKRNIALVSAVGVVSLATLIPLAVVYLNASSTALASQYGSGMQSLGGMLAIWLSTLVPFELGPRQTSIMWGAAVVSFIGLLTSGWWMAFHHATDRERAKSLFIAAIAFPVVGVLSYAPWPTYEERYSFPYLVATSLLIGLAASHLQRRWRMGMLAGGLAWLVIGAFGSSGAAAHASRTDAVQRAADQVVATVASQHGIDSVFVGTVRAANPPWIGLGPTLYRLAAATDRPWPATRDIRCGEIEQFRGTRPLSAIVVFSSQCEATTLPTYRITATHRSVDWRRWRVVVDSMNADILTNATTSVRGARP